MKEPARIDETSDALRSQMLGLDGPPAFMRRSRQVQDAFDAVVARCRHRRDEWLSMVRLRLATLTALAGDWQRLRPWLADDAQVDVLRALHADLQPRLRIPVETTTSTRTLRAALYELIESLERFNHRWQGFLQSVDLSAANEAREKYNRYYLLEKECAVGRAGLSKQDFAQLPPVTLEDVAQKVPLLVVPQVAQD